MQSLLSMISIHAPTRGATMLLRETPVNSRFQSTLPRGERPPVSRGCSNFCNFNPRSHEGSDRKAESKCSGNQRFQSTLPRGERRLGSLSSNTFLHDFNPRSHEGSDMDLQSYEECGIISIHAPTRGATEDPAP